MDKFPNCQKRIRSVFLQSLSRYVIWWLRFRGFIKWLRFHGSVPRTMPLNNITSYCAHAIAERLELRSRRRNNGRESDMRKSIVADYRISPSALDIILYKSSEVYSYRYTENEYGWQRLTRGTVNVKRIGGGPG